MKLLITIGRRSEIIKTAALIEELRKRGIKFVLVDVQQDRGWFMKGAHYLYLRYPKPHHVIKFTGPDIESSTMELFDIINEERPTYVIAAGHSKTVLSTAIASNIAKVPFLHIESGYRTYDLNDEEEIRRHLIDSFSSICYAPTRNAYENLLNEGYDRDKVNLAGSTVVDVLLRFADIAREDPKILGELDLKGDEYCLLTLHKPINVTKNRLNELLKAIESVDKFFIMPVHPETKYMLRSANLYDKFFKADNILMLEPLDYIDFITLELFSSLVITDSGTVSEEAACLGKPVLILGKPTRMELIKEGVALVSDLKKDDIREKIEKMSKLNVKSKRWKIIG